MNQMIETADGVAIVPQSEAMNPLLLLEKAVEQGMDPAQLKALVDLHEQWRAARASEAFAVAMNACQAEMPTVVRDASNSQTKSRYARLEHINTIAKPIYTKHGFALSFAEDDSPLPNFKRIICDVRHTAGHCVRYHLDLPIDGVGAKGNAIGAMNPVQGCISTGTYGQRVLTCRAFNITVADTDMDGQAPLHDNPGHDANAPQAEPRGQRGVQPEVTRDQCAYILSVWKPKNPEPSGDVEAWRRRFYEWVKQTVSRDFPASNANKWRRADYVRCCEELGVPLLEDCTDA